MAPDPWVIYPEPPLCLWASEPGPAGGDEDSILPHFPRTGALSRPPPRAWHGSEPGHYLRGVAHRPQPQPLETSLKYRSPGPSQPY